MNKTNEKKERLSKKDLIEWLNIGSWYDSNSAKRAEVERKLMVNSQILTMDLILWNKLMAICSGLMALATFLIVITTWLKS